MPDLPFRTARAPIVGADPATGLAADVALSPIRSSCMIPDRGTCIWN